MSKNYLNCKIDIIGRAENYWEIKQENGIHENFWSKEVREIENKFIDITDYGNEMDLRRLKLKIFSDWCMDFSDKDI